MDLDAISESLNAATKVEYPPAVIEEKSNELTAFSTRYKELSINLSNDYDFARDNLKKIIAYAMEVVPSAMMLTREAESPRLFESTGSFIKTLSEINKDLLDITERNLKAVSVKKDENDNKTITNTTNNAIFMGTTDELFNQLIKANVAREEENKSRMLQQEALEGDFDLNPVKDLDPLANINKFDLEV